MQNLENYMMNSSSNDNMKLYIAGGVVLLLLVVLIVVLTNKQDPVSCEPVACEPVACEPVACEPVPCELIPNQNCDPSLKCNEGGSCGCQDGFECNQWTTNGYGGKMIRADAEWSCGKP